MLKLNIRHSLLQTNFIEIRFAPESTIDEVKDKLYRMTGTPPEYQELVLVKANQTTILAPNRATLNDFNAQSGDEISLTDRNPNALFGAAFQQAAKNYQCKVVTEEEYMKLTNSVYAQIQFKLENDPSYKAYCNNISNKRKQIKLEEETLQNQMRIGQRCQISGRRRGEIKYLGEMPNHGAGIYVGIQLDEPLGECNGDGKFYCQAKFGIFVKIQDVEVGEFSEIGLESGSEL